jgi:hypothetical protein
MSTQAVSDVKAKEQVEKPAEKKQGEEKRPVRSVNVNLRDGHGSRLKISVKAKKDGTATTFAVHSTKGGAGKKWVNVRGATEHHAGVEAARVEFEKLVATALKAGWVRRERSGGFKAKPDAFDASHLPSPKATKKS